MEPGIVKSVFAILYGCPQDTTEEELSNEMNRRYSLASELIERGARPQSVVDAIEGFDWSAPQEENESRRAARDAAAHSLCRLGNYAFLEVKLLAEKYGGELGIEWASQCGGEPNSMPSISTQ